RLGQLDACRQDDEQSGRRGRWLRLRRQERRQLMLDLLGDDRLTLRELQERFAEELGATVYESEMRSVVRGLVAAGELNREAEPFRPNRGSIRYRYSRRRGLSGSIAELEHAF